MNDHSRGSGARPAPPQDGPARSVSRRFLDPSPDAQVSSEDEDLVGSLPPTAETLLVNSKLASTKLNLLSTTKMIFFIGRGNTGKTTASRFVTEEATSHRRDFFVAACDFGERSLTRYVTDVMSPKTNDLETSTTFLRKMIEAAAREQVSGLVDLGASGEAILIHLHEQVGLIEYCKLLNVVPVFIHTIATGVGDLAVLKMFQEHGIWPEASAIIFNEMLVPAGSDRSEAFDLIARQSCMRKAIVMGTPQLWLPTLWDVVARFHDAAQSGSSTVLRPDYQRMVLAAETGAFDVVVCEAVDRLSRRLSDVAALHDRLGFRGVMIHAPSIGVITTMHIGIMGMMAQMQIADLGAKTKRGQSGRVRAGRVPAGLAFAYAVVPPPPGCKEAGERRIVEAEAATVVRIFRYFADGMSPRQIARKLNKEGVKGPGGRPWLDTTIRGQPERGTGILNNSLYIGELVWNRVSYVKDPATGRREARLNPPEQWEHKVVPELRVVEQELWNSVRQRQVGCALVRDGNTTQTRLNGTHRRKFVLSGLLQCALCGAGYTVMAKDRYGCAMHVKAGTCSNGSTITRMALEGRVLNASRDKMMAPDVIAEFIVAYNDEAAAVRAAAALEQTARVAELVEIDRKIGGLIDAIENGAWSPALQDRLTALEARKGAIIETRLPEPEPTNVVGIRPATAEI